ncbi:MAG: hypothetical protein KGH61_04150 [Candidatus Micrarchaeota archaeon]|nr:hypothetical protein [Candidatus Micrarchaeota archaeon]MDE1848112.1 hypothetical protein [Candidatus Micrarchaeota archaeon]MDE1863919.1 hypothetical protein [Candidatus Micrarchaeota archaeon]
MSKQGSIGLAIVIGFILMTLIGWIPIIGALIAGIITGVIARGAGRGLAAGLLSGVIGLILLAILISILGAALGGSTGALIGGALGVGLGGILGLIYIGGIILVTIGGLIGGAISPRESKEKIKKEFNENEDENKLGDNTEENAIKTLKLRYAKGELSKKQYQLMKKDLEEE